MALADHPLFRKLARLDLPTEHYVIAGSAPMLAHSIKREIHDLDIVAREGAWEKAATLGEIVQAPYSSAKVIYLCDGKIEILDRWFQWGASDLIRTAEMIEGLPFVPLRITVDWKRKLGRPEDKRDIEVIERFLAQDYS